MNNKKSNLEIESTHRKLTTPADRGKSTVVILENIRSGLNVGNIFRSSDAFGIEHIYCIGYTVTPPHREVLKSALGATETVSWSHCEQATTLIEELKSSGYLCVALEQTAKSTFLNDWQSDHKKIAFIFGNEVDGVSQAVIDQCDMTIELPQCGIKHSLNVSVCAGIVLYDVQMRIQDN